MNIALKDKLKNILDCFVATLLAMTVWRCLSSLRKVRKHKSVPDADRGRESSCPWMATFIILPLLFFTLSTLAQNQEPLHVDKAFVLTTSIAPDNTVLLHWKLEKKHYLYRERFHFSVTKPKAASLGKILLPNGVTKYDKIFGAYRIFKNQVTIPVPILNADPNDTILQVSYQGCSESGYCYPPTVRKFNISFATSTVTPIKSTLESEQAKVSELLASKKIIAILIGFLGFGILLSFTPCVLPMIPILSGIIVGSKKHLTTTHAFLLSLFYVLGMSAAYALAGILVGWLGGSVQAFLQMPWVIIIFSLVFVVLALSFFGFYDLELPQNWQEKLSKLSHHQKKGTYLGAFMMGLIASLIVSPCVTPALVGALTYIANTGDAVFGGIALLTLGFGMGIPLLLIGTAGGKLLPKAGTWMEGIKKFFGVLMLGVAIWLLERVLYGPVILFLWGSLLIISAFYLGVASKKNNNPWRKLYKGLGFVCLIYGATLIVGAAMGNDNPLQPLENLTKPISLTTTREFQPVRSIENVNQALMTAKEQRRFVILDFYADWCIACKQMEATTFRDSKVTSLLKSFVLLRANVTANDATDRELLKHFNVVAPPTILFFNPEGELLKSLTIVGEIGPKKFMQHLQRVLSTP